MFAVVLVYCPEGVIPLVVHRKVAQDVPLSRCFIGTEVQGRLIEGAEPDNCQVVLLIDAAAYLELNIVVGGQEWQFQQAEEELEV